MKLQDKSQTHDAHLDYTSTTLKPSEKKISAKNLRLQSKRRDYNLLKQFRARYSQEDL